MTPNKLQSKKKVEYKLSSNFYAQIRKKFGGQFIAREQDKVLAFGKTLKSLFKNMKEKHISHEGSVSVGYVPSKNTVHVYVDC